jgi:hypothetical protein
MISTQARQKPIHSHPNHTIYSKEDPRALITASSSIMIVAHFAKVSTLYP